MLTGGEAHDCSVAESLIRGVDPPKSMIGDKAYDSAEPRKELDELGIKPVIPKRSNRKQPFSFSKRLYKLRWRIEAAFNRLKDFRRIATRYDRLTRNCLASVRRGLEGRSQMRSLNAEKAAAVETQGAAC
jgi:transposase